MSASTPDGLPSSSVGRLLEPRQVALTEATVVAAIGLVVNIISALLLSGGRHHGGRDHHHDHDHRHAGQHHDDNLRAAFVHVLADALMSVLAIAALLAGRFLGWVWLDAVMGIVGAIVIAIWSWTLMRDTAACCSTRQIRTWKPRSARISKPRATPASPIFTSGALDRARTGEVDNETVRSRLAPVHELAHLTVENQVATSCTIRHGDRNPAARPFALNCMPSSLSDLTRRGALR